MSYYDKNLNQVRYRFADKNPKKKTLTAPCCYFYIGMEIIKELGFELGDHLIFIEESKKTFIIERNVFGSRVYSYNKHIDGNYAQLILGDKVIKHFKFPKIKDILVLDHEVHTYENPANNYLVVKF